MYNATSAEIYNVPTVWVANGYAGRWAGSVHAHPQVDGDIHQSNYNLGRDEDDDYIVPAAVSEKVPRKGTERREKENPPIHSSFSPWP